MAAIEKSMQRAKAVPDERVARDELIVSALLRYGVLISLAFVVLGMLLLLITGETGYGSMGDLPSLLTVRDAANVGWPLSPLAVLGGALSLRPFALILLGLLVLILTPVMRVAVSVLLFLREHDPIYIAITLFVLCVLITSFLLGTPGAG